MVAGLLWLVGYPLLLTLFEALEIVGPVGTPLDFTLEHFREFASRGDEWLALWRSVWISVASVVLAGLVGIPLAFVFERTEFPGRRVLGALVALPVALPPLVGVIAFLFLYGESGFVSRVVQMALGLDGAPWSLQGAGAILLVHTYSMYVYFYLFVRAGLSRLDRSVGGGVDAGLVEDSLSVVRRPAPVARSAPRRLVADLHDVPRIVLGTVYLRRRLPRDDHPDRGFEGIGTRRHRPGGGDGAGSGGAAGAVGHSQAPGSRDCGAESRRGAQSPPRGAAVGSQGVGRGRLGPGDLPAAAASDATADLFCAHRHVDHRTAATLAVDGELRRTLLRARAPPPLAQLAMDGDGGVRGCRGAGLPGGAPEPAGRRPHRRPARGSRGPAVGDPGTVFAIALGAAFSVKAPYFGRWVFVGTSVILPLAYLVRCLPITGRSALTGLSQLDPALEEAAEVLGASRRRTLWKVVLPVVRPALFAGLGLAFITALGDFVTSIVLYTFNTRPISIEIMSALRVQEFGIAAAYGVLLMVLSALAFLAWGRGDKAA